MHRLRKFGESERYLEVEDEVCKIPLAFCLLPISTRKLIWIALIMNRLEKWFLSLPLTEAARQSAEQFAKEQPTPQKAQQVRLNTLAVWIVNDYLDLMGIPTNLTRGDSWNPVVRLCADVADLEVTGLGYLECRPLERGTLTCSIPPEVWQDRIGYVVVQIHESLREATLLGFTPTATVEEFPLTQLQSLEALLIHLEQLRQSIAVAPSVANRMVVNLRQWLEGVFAEGWQAVEDFLAPEEPNLAFSFRGASAAEIAESETIETGIRRAKSIDLGGDHLFLLVVELQSETEQTTNICIQVHPTGNQLYLSPNLQMMVLDDSGAVFLESQSRQMDQYMQLYFRGQVGEQFSVSITLDDSTITEDFSI